MSGMWTVMSRIYSWLLTLLSIFAIVFNRVYILYKRRLLQRSEDYKMAVTATMTIQAAVAHISIYGSGHSECIVTENDWAADYFMKMVDAACVYVNVPTSFTDGGEFGLGAEIGISTQKLHARGPMGLEELNTYKWIIQGDGQIRQ